MKSVEEAIRNMGEEELRKIAKERLETIMKEILHIIKRINVVNKMEYLREDETYQGIAKRDLERYRTLKKEMQKYHLWDKEYEVNFKKALRGELKTWMDEDNSK